MDFTLSVVYNLAIELKTVDMTSYFLDVSDCLLFGCCILGSQSAPSPPTRSAAYSLLYCDPVYVSLPVIPLQFELVAF